MDQRLLTQASGLHQLVGAFRYQHPRFRLPQNEPWHLESSRLSPKAPRFGHGVNSAGDNAFARCATGNVAQFGCVQRTRSSVNEPGWRVLRRRGLLALQRGGLASDCGGVGAVLSFLVAVQEHAVISDCFLDELL
jgi:hypothetical protein